MFEILQTFDLSLLHAINSDWTNPFLDWFMALVTDYGYWKWPMLVGALVLFVWGGYRGRLFVIMTVALLVAGEGITGAIKRITNRPRPYQQLENIRVVDLSGVRIYQPGPVEKGRSMPSGHTANIAAFAFLASAIYSRWGKLAWILAITVAYSRIYTGNHYPSDVAVALILSSGYSQAAVWTAPWLWRRLGPKWLSASHLRHPDLFPARSKSV